MEAWVVQFQVQLHLKCTANCTIKATVFLKLHIFVCRFTSPLYPPPPPFSPHTTHIAPPCIPTPPCASPSPYTPTPPNVLWMGGDLDCVCVCVCSGCSPPWPLHDPSSRSLGSSVAPVAPRAGPAYCADDDDDAARSRAHRYLTASCTEQKPARGITLCLTYLT